jgi:hypothetical protein
MSTFLSGIGTPRLIRVLARPSGMITSASVANPTNLLCPAKHRLISGQTVRIAGVTGSTPAVDGDRVVTVIDERNFTVPLNVTVAGAGGSFDALTHIYESTGTTTFDATHAYETGSPAFLSFPVDTRISSFVVSGALVSPTFAKVTAKATGILTVDAWTNGTPTGGQKFSIDGYIVDLPRTQEQPERFTPDTLIHSLYGGDEGSKLETKFKGFKYQCTLDFSAYASADMLMDLAKVLRCAPNDRLILIPRKDTPQFQYNVFLAEPFDLVKARLEGHKKPVFVFAGKENIASYAVLGGYGTGYGTDYGNCY